MRQLRRRGLVAVWLVSLAVVTSLRCRVWHSDDTLWANAAAVTPMKPRPVMNYARTIELAGDFDKAEALYREVISLTFYPQRGDYVRKFSRAAAETNIAHLYMKQGKFASAMKILDGLEREWPTFPYAHYNRGAILAWYGACEDAAKEYAVALAIDPTLPSPKACKASGTP